MLTLKLLHHLHLTADMTLLTGLRIGGTADKVEIGGVDNPVIKDKEGRPYVPGSSLKGKLRTLLEFDLGKVKEDGGIWSAKDASDPIVRLFGAGNVKDNPEIGPTRLIVRDSRPSGDWAADAPVRKRKMPYELVETKTEVTISRLTGTAGGGGPRQMERVVPGVVFGVEILCRVFDLNDDKGKTDEDMFRQHISRALELLELDCLGGSGSRGYGKVKFSSLKLPARDGVVSTWQTASEFAASHRAT